MPIFKKQKKVKKSRCIHDIIFWLKRRYYALYEAFRRLINLKKAEKGALPGFSRNARWLLRKAIAVLRKALLQKGNRRFPQGPDLQGKPK